MSSVPGPGAPGYVMRAPVDEPARPETRPVKADVKPAVEDKEEADGRSV